MHSEGLSIFNDRGPRPLRSPKKPARTEYGKGEARGHHTSQETEITMAGAVE
jgi:hypothetical protein